MRKDEVFLLTLIDFLVQVCFFGVLVFTAAEAVGGGVPQSDGTRKKMTEREAVEEVKKRMGVSDFTQLTDDLTRLAPIKDLHSIAELVETVERDHGGAKTILPKLEELRRLKERFGKPPCLYDGSGDRKVSRPVATAIATDDRIEFQGMTPELLQVLKLIGQPYPDIQSLSLPEFRRRFGSLTHRQPDCFYSLRLIENTRLVDARDAASIAFYLAIQR